MANEFNIQQELGIRLYLACPLCSVLYDKETCWPTTGRCGHTICSQCLQERVVESTTNDGRWQPCPIGSCTFQASFEIQASPNVAILQQQNNCREAEEALAIYIYNAKSQNAARKEMEDMRKIWSAAMDQKRKDIAEKEKELQQLQWKLESITNFQANVQRRGVMYYSDGDESSGSSPDAKPNAKDSLSQSISNSSPFVPNPPNAEATMFPSLSNSSASALKTSNEACVGEKRLPPRRRFRLPKVSLEGKPGCRNVLHKLRDETTNSTSEEEFE